MADTTPLRLNAGWRLPRPDYRTEVQGISAFFAFQLPKFFRTISGQKLARRDREKLLAMLPGND